MTDAANFGFVVAHGVDTFALSVFERGYAARLTEINVAGKLAHDHQIKAGYDFRFQGRGRGQFGVEQCRTQIGKQIELLADAQEAALRAHIARQTVILPVTHGTQQHRI